MIKQYLKASDISRMMNVPLSTVYFWVQTGRLKPIRIGRIIRFDPDAIAQLIQNGDDAPGGRKQKGKNERNC